jgi:lipopolysaccharide transport system permease protein
VPEVLARRLRTYPLELLYNLTLRELRGKYKRSALGWLWSIINPLANIAVYSVVFGVFFDVDAPVGDPSGLQVYALFLVAGLLPWTFLSNGLGGAVGSIVANESLVKKVYFPRWILPTSAVGAWFAGFAIELLVFGIILVIAGNAVFLWVPLVLVLMVLQATFVVGLGLILAAVNVYFRDVQHFLAILLNIWFYATPVLYPPDLPPETYELGGWEIPVQDILALNPMAIFLDAYRDILYHLRYPTLTQMAVLTIGSLATLTAGITVFRRFEPRLAEVL